MSRFGKDDWMKVGYAALKSSVPDAMTLDGLCGRAQKTKGSFYHHFSSVPDFIKSLLDDWETTATQAVTADVEKSSRGLRGLQLLQQITSELDVQTEKAVRSLAERSQDALGHIQRVDAQRIAFLERLHQSLPGATRQRAALLARVEYATFVGLMYIDQDAIGEDRNKLYNLFLDTIVTGAKR